MKTLNTERKITYEKTSVIHHSVLALLVALPGHAGCPLSHTDKRDKNVTSAKNAPVVKSHSYATPEPTVSWHDLHWFE